MRVVCILYVVCCILVADVYTHFARSSNHSTKLLLTLMCWCWYATYMLMCYVLCAVLHVICNLCLYMIVSAVHLRAPMCWCWGKTQSGTLIPRSLPPVMRFALGLIKHIWLFLSNNHQGRCYSSFVPQFVLPSPSSSATWDLKDLILSPFLPFHCIMRAPVGQIL